MAVTINLNPVKNILLSLTTSSNNGLSLPPPNKNKLVKISKIVQIDCFLKV